MSSSASSIAVVAIDGPAGSGKSTVAKRVADAMGFAYLDSGAMYRAATWHALNEGVDMGSQPELVLATESMKLDLEDAPDGLKVRVNDVDVTHAIREPEVTENIRILAAIPGVRKVLGRAQRLFGERQPTVAEGRDMATVVFPDAACKIYLDAEPEVRAKRRQEELETRGVSVELSDLLYQVNSRDASDRERAAGPLTQADDAIRLDTSGLEIDEVVAVIVERARGCGL